MKSVVTALLILVVFGSGCVEKRAVDVNDNYTNATKSPAIAIIPSGQPATEIVKDQKEIIKQPEKSVEITQTKVQEKDKTDYGTAYAKRVENTSISGQFGENQIWSGEILITGDTRVDGDLTILPGTVVKFDVGDDIGWGNEISPDGYNDMDPTRLRSYETTHSDLVINGKLIAMGIPDKKIVFTSAASTPNYADWLGIHIGGDKSIMEYTIVEWSRHGISMAPNTPNTIIRNNIINYTFWGSISSGFSSSQIYNNEIWEAGHEGIDVQGGNPIIENNRIYNAHTGIVILDGSAIIRNNTMINVGNGLHIEPDATPTSENNHVELAPGDSALEWRYGNFAYKMFGDPVVRG